MVWIAFHSCVVFSFIVISSSFLRVILLVISLLILTIVPKCMRYVATTVIRSEWWVRIRFWIVRFSVFVASEIVISSFSRSKSILKIFHFSIQRWLKRITCRNVEEIDELAKNVFCILGLVESLPSVSQVLREQLFRDNSFDCKQSCNVFLRYEKPHKLCTSNFYYRPKCIVHFCRDWISGMSHGEKFQNLASALHVARVMN